MPELVLYGIRLLAPASLGKLSANESAVILGAGPMRVENKDLDGNSALQWSEWLGYGAMTKLLEDFY